MRGSRRLQIDPHQYLTVEDVALKAKDVRVPAGPESRAQPPQRGRIEQLVAVDTDDPGRRARVFLERPMCVTRLRRASNLEVVELSCELVQDHRRAIVRQVIKGVDPVAECSDVSDRLLDEDVFVSNEHRADDRTASSGTRQR